jgi:hypothetical protein
MNYLKRALFVLLGALAIREVVGLVAWFGSGKSINDFRNLTTTDVKDELAKEARAYRAGLRQVLDSAAVSRAINLLDAQVHHVKERA